MDPPPLSHRRRGRVLLRVLGQLSLPRTRDRAGARGLSGNSGRSNNGVPDRLLQVSFRRSDVQGDIL